MKINNIDEEELREDLKFDYWECSDEKISQSVSNIAFEIYRAIAEADYRMLNTFPGFNGEIQICCYEDDYTHEFTVNKDTKITYNRVLEIEQPEVDKCMENLTLNRTMKIIENLKSIDKSKKK